METNYVVLLDFCSGSLNIIRLTEDEIAQSEKYDDFGDFLSTLEDKYDFRLDDCQWMCCETLAEYRYEDGELSSTETF